MHASADVLPVRFVEDPGGHRAQGQEPATSEGTSVVAVKIPEAQPSADLNVENGHGLDLCSASLVTELCRHCCDATST